MTFFVLEAAPDKLNVTPTKVGAYASLSEHDV